MSDYNRQFLFETKPAQGFTPTKKATLRQRLSQRASLLTGSVVLIIGASLGAAVGAGVGIGVYNYWTRPAPIVVNNADSVSWVTAAAAKASPSVATISVSSASGGGNGSGVFLTADGYLLTNTHVVTLDGATSSVKVEVKTYDGHIYPAKVVGTDPTNDLAVIKVTSPIQFTPVEFADSNQLNVGDATLAIGAPLGLSNTVTKGIVSALNRTIQVASAAAPDNSSGGGLQFYNGSGESINLRVIQTDAAINPGNSGGALVDVNGHLIGINSAIYSRSGGNMGIGFAIPVATALSVMKDLIRDGKVTRGWIGVEPQDLNPELASTFNLPSGTGKEALSGVVITGVLQNGPAAQAGIRPGDVIVKVNSQAIGNVSELLSTVANLQPGTKAQVQVWRRQGLTDISVTPSQRPAPRQRPR